MSSTKDSGLAIRTMGTSLSAPNSSESFDGIREWVAAEHQTVNELVPGGKISDHAARIMLDSLEKIAREIGREKFHAVVLKIIDTCERRPTIATYRKLAGLNARLSPQDEVLAAAWELVTVIVTRFLSHDGNGNVSVRPRISVLRGKHIEEPPPHIPESVKLAVISMGGWKALSEGYPEWWSQRFYSFKELFRPSPEDSQKLSEGSKTAILKT